MDKEYRYLLGILRAYILQQEPEQNKQVNWTNLVELARIHHVTGILGYMSMKYPICPDSEIQTGLRQICLANMSHYAQRSVWAEELFAELEENRIAYCPMKGILVRNLYPVPELRTFSDVDFLIRTEDRQRTHRLMLDLGFVAKNDWEPIYSYTRGGEFYEIHTQIMEVDLSDKADYRGFFDRAWENTLRVSDFGYQLSPEFHLLYLLTHIAKHVTGSGAGARLYLDIAVYLMKYGSKLNWAYIRLELKNLALWEFACTVFSVAESWFGVSCPIDYDKTDPHILDRFLEYTMEAGVYGRFQRETALSTLKKGKGSRFSIFLRRLFPSAKDLEMRYTYLQKCPWLLPIAWIHRLLITARKAEAHAKEAKIIMTADTTEVNRLKAICRDIGL